jgi:hypothetical protein
LQTYPLVYAMDTACLIVTIQKNLSLQETDILARPHEQSALTRLELHTSKRKGTPQG